MAREIKDLVKDFSEVLKEFPEVKYVGDEILKKETEEVSFEEGIEIGKKLGEVLLKYRKAVGYGRGFAAPQIGINKSVFVTFVNDELQTFINPKIIEKSESTNLYKELCLSSGIMSADVERSEWIVLEWTDENRGLRKEKFEGFLARLYQHEVDHLLGFVNLDRATKSGIEFATFDPLKELLRPSNK